MGNLQTTQTDARKPELEQRRDNEISMPSPETEPATNVSTGVPMFAQSRAAGAADGENNIKKKFQIPFGSGTTFPETSIRMSPPPIYSGVAFPSGPSEIEIHPLTPTVWPLGDNPRVKIHSTDGVADEHGARAMTIGDRIQFAKSTSNAYFDHASVLAHELTHVVQQRRGAIGPPFSSTEALEAEAHAAAPVIASGGIANIAGVARPGAPQFLLTDEGDYVPDTLIVDWSERFQITFGVRTTGYGDVLLQYKIRYLGSFTGEASDLYFIIERDPGGPWELGKPHTRRLDARLIDATSESIKIDVYGDGTVIHELWHAIAWSANNPGGVHQFELLENGKFAHRRTLTSMRTPGVDLGQEKGVEATVEAPTYKPDPQRAPQLPVGMLVDMINGRLDDLHSLPLSVKLLVLRIKLNEIKTSSTQAGDDSAIALRARGLLDLLTYLGPVFKALEDLLKPEQYLGGLEDDAIAEVNRITDLYIDAIVETFVSPGETQSLAAADQAMRAFPDWLNFLYLRDPRGVQSMIGQVPAMQTELIEWRDKNNTTWSSGMRDADDMVRIHWGKWGPGSLHGELSRQREKAELAWRGEEKDVQELISDLYARAQLSIGMLTAMTVHQQVLYIARELNGSWINAGMENTFWGDRTEKAWKYVRNIGDIIQTLSDTEYEKDGFKKQAAVQAGLAQLSELLSSGAFTSDMDDFQTRLKWVDRISFVAKLAVIVAAAALTGGTAGSLAFAGLRALGAGVTLATAGELVIGGLVFTAVSRGGQEIMFGKAEGNFFVDWFWNSATLGVLKAANYGFVRLFKYKFGLDPNIAKVRFHLGRTATAMVALQGVAEMHHLVSKQSFMSGEERVNAIFQNVALMVALEAGRFITAPLEARLTKTLITKLRIDAKMAARIDALAAQRKPLIDRLESLSRGETAPAEIEKLVKDIEGLWAEELRLVNDGVNRKILNEAEMESGLVAYRQHIAGMQLRLSQLGIEAPGYGGTAFRPVARGVVAYTAEGRAALEKYYTPDPNDPASAGKSLKESTEMPGVLEGRLPNGELTYYIPEGSFPQGIPDTQAIIAGRDAAVLAAKGDPLAAEGLRRLQAGLKGMNPAEKGLAQRNVDAILGAVAPEAVTGFLRAMADPAFAQGVGVAFYTGLAGRPAAIEFARAYGPAAVIRVWRAFYQDWATTDAMLQKARAELESRTPAERQAFLDKLVKGDRAAVEKLLGESKAKAPPEKPVSKKTMGVDRSTTEWLALRNDAVAFAKRHNANLPDSALDSMADLYQIHAKALRGKYGAFGQAAKESLLDRFDALADDIARAEQTPGAGDAWAKTMRGWTNSMRGAVGEGLARPAGVPKHLGGFLNGQPVPSGTAGATIPDYAQTVGSATEWVNIKSDILTDGVPGAQTGVYASAMDAARAYRGKANTEAANLPKGEQYSLQFVRDPLRAKDTAAGKRTEGAMLDVIFGNDSPVARVKFGDRPWITREAWISGGGK